MSKNRKRELIWELIDKAIDAYKASHERKEPEKKSSIMLSNAVEDFIENYEKA